MNTATAAKPLLSIVPPQGKDKSKLKIMPGIKSADSQPPSETKTDELDLIDRFDVARLDLASYLDAIYRIGFSGHYIEMNTETILVLAGKAEDTLKELNKVFEEIIGAKGGEIDEQ